MLASAAHGRPDVSTLESCQLGGPETVGAHAVHSSSFLFYNMMLSVYEASVIFG